MICVTARHHSHHEFDRRQSEHVTRLIQMVQQVVVVTHVADLRRTYSPQYTPRLLDTRCFFTLSSILLVLFCAK